MNFDLLTNTILEIHTSLQQRTVKVINIHLTIRNWLIGFYIANFGEVLNLPEVNNRRTFTEEKYDFEIKNR